MVTNRSNEWKKLKKSNESNGCLDEGSIDIAGLVMVSINGNE